MAWQCTPSICFNSLSYCSVLYLTNILLLLVDHYSPGHLLQSWASMSSSASGASSSLSQNRSGTGACGWVLREATALESMVLLPEPTGDPTDIGLSVHDVHLRVPWELPLLGVWLNPEPPLIDDPGASPSSALSWSVTGDIHLPWPKSAELPVGALSSTRLNGAMVTGPST